MKMDEEEEDQHQRGFLFLNPESKWFRGDCFLFLFSWPSWISLSILETVSKGPIGVLVVQTGKSVAISLFTKLVSPTMVSYNSRQSCAADC